MFVERKKYFSSLKIRLSRAIRADSITAAAVEAARGHSEMQLQSRGGARPT